MSVKGIFERRANLKIKKSGINLPLLKIFPANGA